MPFDGSKFDVTTFDRKVELRRLATRTEGIDPKIVPFESHQAVVDVETDQVLAVHSDRYRLTPHSHVFDALNGALKTCGLPLDNVDVHDELLDRGCVAKRDIIVRDIVAKPQVNDIVHMRLRALNSYDGSFSLVLEVGGLRLWCLNGCTTPDRSMITRVKHTSTIDVAAEAERLAGSIEFFKNAEGVWGHWARTPMPREDMVRLVEQTIAAAPTPSKPDNVNRSIADAVMHGHDRDGAIRGTMWGLYNGATWWATHGDTSGRARDDGIVRIRRDAQVRAMVNSPQWKAAVA